jgi:hypothetical protein
MKNYILTFSFLLQLSTVLCQAPPTGLRAYFPMNGNFTDLGPFDYFVTNTNVTPTSNNLGLTNSAMSFNNSIAAFNTTATSYGIWAFDYQINFGTTSDFTISINFKVNGFPGANTTYGLYDNNLTRQGYGLDVNTNSTNQCRVSFSAFGNGINTNPSTTPINTGVWYNAIGIKQGTTIKLYINGILASSRSISGFVLTPNYLVESRFGSMSSTIYNYGGLPGALDEYRVYNRALSDAEVAALYCASINSSTPQITAGSATTFCTGGNVTLTSNAATGNQWYKNAVLIGGATNTTYNATTSGNYTVKSTVNGCTSVASNAIAVTVNPIPNTPTISPSNTVSACIGQTVTLTSSASSGNQWYKNGVLINGATSNTYGATTAGVYTVVVTASGCSSTASNPTTVNFTATPSAPTITAGSSTTFCAGGSVTLTSSSTSSNQWYKDGTAITGATAATYVVNASGSYTVLYSIGSCTSPQSTATVVTVNALPATPSITAGGATTFCTGGSVTLTSNATSGNQWYLNGTAIGGATATTYSATTSGNYTVAATLTGCTSAQSSATAVTVNAIPITPTITAGGPNIFCAGGSVTLTSNAASGNQWYNGATLITGAINTTYTATASGTYNTKVSVNGCTSAASNNITVTANPIPAQPPITWSGTQFSTTSGFATYKWYLNNVLISGANTNTYIPTGNGIYKVEVTDANGCINTSVDYNLVNTGINTLVVEGTIIDIMPNPATSFLTLKVIRQINNSKFTVSLFDNNGKLVLQQLLRNGDTKLNVSNLNNGTYLVQITGTKELKTLKINILH